MALTDRQEKYAQAVASGLSPLDAAKAAGYKAIAASKQAARMAQNENVQNRIAELKAYQLIQHGERDIKEKPSPFSVESTNKSAASKVRAVDFLRSVYCDVRQPMKLRIQAAVSVLPYEEAKIAQKGKKEEAKDTAKMASETSPFATFSNQQDIFKMS